MKTLLALFLCATASLAQSITIPAQTFSTPVTINGVTVQVSITVPSQLVSLPASTGSLPTGMTYSSSTGLSVTGPITSTGQVTATQVSLTGGSAPPTCASGLYLFSYAATTTTLSLACYTPAANPAITVSQAAGGAITLTPSL